MGDATTRPKTTREALKVGDRVRACGQPVCGSYDVTSMEGDSGTVVGFSPEGWVRVKTDNDYGFFPEFHPRQVRRLRPKAKAQEFWINPRFLPIHPALMSSVNGERVASTGAEPGFIHVREVGRAGKKV